MAIMSSVNNNDTFRNMACNILGGVGRNPAEVPGEYLSRIKNEPGAGMAKAIFDSGLSTEYLTEMLNKSLGERIATCANKSEFEAVRAMFQSLKHEQMAICANRPEFEAVRAMFLSLGAEMSKVETELLLKSAQNAAQTANVMAQIKQADGFLFCSPRQRAAIEAAIQQKIEEGETPQSAMELGGNMVLQFKRAKETMAADAVAQLREIDNFQACTPEQRAYIETYATQMVMYGDKPEFAVKVGADMALLYRNGIDEMLPGDLLNSHKCPDDDTGEKYKEFAILNEALVTSYANATTEMYRIMDANGGSSRVMKFFLERQKASSETQVSRAAQCFLLCKTKRQSL
jgi:NAD(P)H-dependent FMN reductase